MSSEEKHDAAGADAAAVAAADADCHSELEASRQEAKDAHDPKAAGSYVPLADAPICPVCLDAFACEESKEAGESRIPRTLPCAHSACSGCLLQLLTRTPGSVDAHGQPPPCARLCDISRSALAHSTCSLVLALSL